MIIANDIKYGLDVNVYRLQQYLDKKLPDYMIYAVLHENQKQEGLVLEWSKEEKEVFVDDREKAIIGFRLLSKEVNSFLGTASLDLIVTLQTDNREKTEAEIYKYIVNSGFVNDVTGVKIGIGNVFSGLYNEEIIYRDIYPYHVFAYTIDVNYNIDSCQQ